MSAVVPGGATRCADESTSAGVALAGTATQAVDWLVVERRGAWGRDGVADTDLPNGARQVLDRFAASGRVLLARRPDRRGSETVVFRARTDESGGTLTRTVLPGLEALTQADVDAGGESVPAPPLVLVCAHGRRDPCCARLGPPVYDALAPHADPALLWQSSHHGGHRFAANVLALPAGIQLGRVTPEDARRVASLLVEGRIPLDLYRGRTIYPGPVQAAEVAIRQRLELDRVADLALLEERDEEIRFAYPNGEVTARVIQVPGPPVPPSCGADPEATVRYAVELGP